MHHDVEFTQLLDLSVIHLDFIGLGERDAWRRKEGEGDPPEDEVYISGEEIHFANGLPEGLFPALYLLTSRPGPAKYERFRRATFDPPIFYRFFSVVQSPRNSPRAKPGKNSSARVLRQFPFLN
jgi:hypothetical protein